MLVLLHELQLTNAPTTSLPQFSNHQTATALSRLGKKLGPAGARTYWCTGYKPNTEYIKDARSDSAIAQSLDAGGYVVVDKAMRPDAVMVILSQVSPGFTRPLPRPGAVKYYQVETLIFGRAIERAMYPERFIVGCDGFHGPSRKAIPDTVGEEYLREYPFGWLGILANTKPSKEVALFSHNERGFALLSMRSESVGRFYLQCKTDENLDEWPDDRIWDELDARLGAPGWMLERGEITQKDVTPLRSFFSEPMQHGRLFLAGDAAHIVPPTGAKGLNSAVADVNGLACALIDGIQNDDETLLRDYSDIALRRNWQVQRFSWSNTAMYHIFPESNSFTRRMQEAQIEYLVTDKTAQTLYAQNHTGLPIEHKPDF